MRILFLFIQNKCSFKIARIIFILSITFCGIINTGKSQQYSFTNYGIEDGLAQSQVTAILQDTGGYIWFGTFGGISRFDGINFTNYSVENGLIDNQINFIFLDHTGALWVATIGGICKFNGQEFEQHLLTEEHKNDKITSITETDKGELWISSENGVFKLTPGGMVNVPTHDSSIRCILLCNDDVLRIGTKHGIEEFRNNSFSVVANTEKWNVSCLINGKNKDYWACTYGSGVLQITQQKIVSYSTDNDLISNSIRFGQMDQKGAFWFASKIGISKVIDDSVQSFTTKSGLPHSDIRVVYTDTEDNLWLGTNGKGILRFAGEGMIHIDKKDGLSSDLVLSITEDNMGNLWFSTYDNGISKLKDNKFTTFSLNDGLLNNTVWASSLLKDGSIWFGTSGGVNVISEQQITSYTTSDGLINNKVTAICQAINGDVWLGTRKGVSIFRNDTFYDFSSEKEFQATNIRVIKQDNSGKIWIGAEEGLFTYFKNKINRISVNEGLPNNTIYSITQDNHNNLWVGTKEGLAFIKDGKITLFYPGSSNSANYILFLKIDRNNTLWIGTNNGLFSIDLNLLYQSGQAIFKRYTLLDGLTSLECNQNAAFIDSKGMLWIGTGAGVVKINTALVKQNQNKVICPKIHLTDVRLFMEKTNWKKYSKSINKSTGLPENLVVKYALNHFTFYYTGIYQTNPNLLLYKYKLDGFDNDWQPITQAQFATYSNLPYGNYTFKVLAGTQIGNWNNKPAIFHFEILAPFWLTWWFFSICFLFIVALVFGFSVWRIRVNKQKSETLLFRYRSRMLALEHQTLNSSMNRHFIFNALSSIQYYINTQDRLSANRYLSNFAKLIRKNLDSSTSGTMVPLSEELDRLKLYLNLESMRFQNKFEYEIVVDNQLNISEILVPSMLLQPFVENSLWHGILPKGSNGKIDISFAPTEKDELHIIIADDGIGIEKSKSIKPTNIEPHISKGMQITKARLKLIKEITKQNIYIKGPYERKVNNVTAGTIVEIFLALNPAALLDL